MNEVQNGAQQKTSLQLINHAHVQQIESQNLYFDVNVVNELHLTK